ncbi:hypothetical protein, partial [Ralstonia pseudosolanacearum]|uniref:hypothetical protein n=1 Tax=Ralstonia pseudosolanacearum TaxID=1310165 RepID=UPI001E2A858B
GKSRESTQSAGLFTALSVWTVARKRQLAAWRGGFMQQRRARVRCPESEEDAGGYTPGVPGIQVDIDGPFLEQPAFHAAMPRRPITQS